MVKLFIGAFFIGRLRRPIYRVIHFPHASHAGKSCPAGDLLACSWWGYKYIALSGLVGMVPAVYLS